MNDSGEAMPETNLQCLADSQPGMTVKVASVSGDDQIATRILEMGVTPGCEIRVVGVAPLGDPIEIEVRSYRLSLRLEEAKRIITY